MELHLGYATMSQALDERTYGVKLGVLLMIHMLGETKLASLG